MSITPLGSPLVPLEYGSSASVVRARPPARGAGPAAGDQAGADVAAVIEQHGGAGVGELALELGRRAAGADAGHRAAGGHRAEGDPGPRRDVRRLQREHVARGEAARGERGGDALGALGEQRRVGDARRR